ncbi:hypothetical protein JCM8097_007513 [Rhodosporidiobolus ruineniae]
MPSGGLSRHPHPPNSHFPASTSSSSAAHFASTLYDDDAETPARQSAGLPPVLGPDGRPLQGNALTNAFVGGRRVETANGGERTSRACLACRRLKSRCDGAEDPPCKRCRAGGLECVFVESKRGKRPSKKGSAAASSSSTTRSPPTVTDSLLAVQSKLSSVLDALQQGEQPDPTALEALQASLADGLASSATGGGSGKRRGSSASGQGRRVSLSRRGGGTEDDQSPSSSSEFADGKDIKVEAGGGGAGRKTKRARRDGPGASGGAGSTSSGLSVVGDSPFLGGGAILPSPGTATFPLPPQHPPLLPFQPPGGRRASSAHVYSPQSGPSPPVPSTSGVQAASPQNRQQGPSTPLSLLADASLAAQIDGRSALTGLDADFKLSVVTDALEKSTAGKSPFGLGDFGGAAGVGMDDGGMGGKTPAVLAKGIVTPELAVELFTIFFDYCYIHLPLLDPARHTAPLVCATSPFLFTVILAVASRFHSSDSPSSPLDASADPTLCTRIYDEAHACFVECLSEGERTIEAVQACCLLTLWTYPPTSENAAAGREERPKRAWLYFGMAVRMALELSLFRPVPFVDAHLSKPGVSAQANPWATLDQRALGISDEVIWDALNRERTWLLVFVIDRNMSAVMGRPYQIQEAKPLLLPLHPLCLPFDLGVIAHVELQTIIGQVMDNFRDRIYGLSSASDEMPSQVVMKLFNSRMDEWKARWCPVAGEPIANNLQFYFFASKLFLNTIPLHTLLRSNGDASDDPDSVSSTISAAKSLLDLGHAYAELSVLRHCPDVNFLLMLYSTVFLVKVRVSNSRFAQLVAPEELETLLLRLMKDCQEAAQGDGKHAALTCFVMVRALGASWRAMEGGGSNVGSGPGRSRANSKSGTGPGVDLNMGSSLGLSTGADFSSSLATALTGASPSGSNALPQVSLAGSFPPSPAFYNSSIQPFSAAFSTATATAPPSSLSAPSNPFANPFGPNSNAATPMPSYRLGTLSGMHTPTGFAGSTGGPGILDGAGAAGGTGAAGGLEGVDHFLSDSHFFGNVLVGRGASGFFDWPEVAGSLDISTASPFPSSSLAAGAGDPSDPFSFASFSYIPHGGATRVSTPTVATAGMSDPMLGLAGGATPAVSPKKESN